MGWVCAKSAHTTMITGCSPNRRANWSVSAIVRAVSVNPVCTLLAAPPVPRSDAAPARAAAATSSHSGRYHSPSCLRSAGSLTKTKRTAHRLPPLGANRASSTALSSTSSGTGSSR